MFPKCWHWQNWVEMVLQQLFPKLVNSRRPFRRKVHGMERVQSSTILQTRLVQFKHPLKLALSFQWHGVSKIQNVSVAQGSTRTICTVWFRFQIVKTVRLSAWSVSLNLLYDFTLFVIEIYDYAHITVPTPFDHFPPNLFLTLLQEVTVRLNARSGICEVTKPKFAEMCNKIPNAVNFKDSPFSTSIVSAFWRFLE